MSAAAYEPFECGDDWLDVADAFGVTREHHPDNLLNFRPQPAHRVEFSDAAIAARLDEWAAEADSKPSTAPVDPPSGELP